MDLSSKVVAVTVTFNPELAIFREQLHALEHQCRVVVVDNRSDQETVDEIRSIVASFANCELVELDSNHGIAFAQNAGIDRAIRNWPNGENGYVLTLDHDSVPGNTYVQSLVECAVQLQLSDCQIGAVGPVLCDARTGNDMRLHKIHGFFWKKLIPVANGESVMVDSVNSSGSLIPVSTIKTVGQFDSSLFIDHVDTEWCFRAMDKGFGMYIDQNTRLDHRMGDDMMSFWLFGKREMPYRSPNRHYYIFRNSILLQRRTYIPKVWKFWNILKLGFTWLTFGIGQREAKQHRKMMWRGIMDGVKGKSGQR